MCLAVPMKIEEIDGHRARCTALGTERWADLTLMGDQPPAQGEFVVIHLGFVQRVVTEQAANDAYAMFDQIIDTLDAAEK